MKPIKSLGKKVLRSFVEAPWNSDIMEFQHGLWRGVSALFTESGRQLGEENARPFLFNDHIPAKTIICKYDGSRNGHPINMSALRIAMTNFDAALDITKVVVRHHARAASENRPNAVPGIWDLYVIALASIALIAYSVRKQPSTPASPVVSDELASQYQFIAGIFMICRHMIDENSELIIENNPVSAVQLYDYADEHKIFESFNGMVCAGSTKKIMEFLEFCTTELSSAFSEPASYAHEPHSSPLEGFIDDLDQWYRYAISSIELDCFIKIERRKSRVGSDAASREHDQTSLTTYQNISTYSSALLQPSSAYPDGAFESGALNRQNKVLSFLDRKPIKKIKQNHLDDQLSFD